MKSIKVKAAKVEAEYNAIVEALKRTNFHKTKAAAILGIDRKTLANRLKRYKIITGLLKESTEKAA